MWILKGGFKVDRVFMDFILFISLAFTRPRAEDYIYIFTTIYTFYFFLKTSIIRYMIYLFLCPVLCGLLMFFFFSHIILLVYINVPSLNTYRTTYVLLASVSLS